ncbi:hypothetical protein BHM03_00004136 [Ensete ventricosum]|nr:hypothetical protein BHM03_00004136 [Ensete ventricosum]
MVLMRHDEILNILNCVLQERVWRQFKELLPQLLLSQVKGQDVAFEPAKLLWLIQRDFLPLEGGRRRLRRRTGGRGEEEEENEKKKQRTRRGGGDDEGMKRRRRERDEDEEERTQFSF